LLWFCTRLMRQTGFSSRKVSGTGVNMTDDPDGWKARYRPKPAITGHYDPCPGSTPCRLAMRKDCLPVDEPDDEAVDDDLYPYTA